VNYVGLAVQGKATHRMNEKLHPLIPARVWGHVHWFRVTDDTLYVSFEPAGVDVLDDTNTLVFPHGTPLDAIVARICLECP
jgi:hypothetical protein